MTQPENLTPPAPALPVDRAPQTSFAIHGEPSKLFSALAKAQGAFSKIVRDVTVNVRTRDGGSYSYEYAPLERVLEACIPALSANGLALIQPPHGSGRFVVRTLLTHESGAYIECLAALPAPKEGAEQKMQDLGGQMTFMRRYVAQALLGVSAEDDDDANQSDGNQATRSGPRANTQGRPPEKPQAAQQKPAPAKETPRPEPAPQPAPAAAKEPERPKSTPPPLPQTPAPTPTTDALGLPSDAAPERTVELDAAPGPADIKALAGVFGELKVTVKADAQDILHLICGKRVQSELTLGDVRKASVLLATIRDTTKPGATLAVKELKAAVMNAMSQPQTAGDALH